MLNDGVVWGWEGGWSWDKGGRVMGESGKGEKGEEEGRKNDERGRKKREERRGREKGEKGKGEQREGGRKRPPCTCLLNRHHTNKEVPTQDLALCFPILPV